MIRRIEFSVITEIIVIQCNQGKSFKDDEQVRAHPRHNLPMVKTLLLALLMAVHALATGTTLPDCKSGSTPPEMNACAARNYRAADAVMHIKYGEVMDRQTVAVQARLRREQHAWLRQRDLQCKAHAKPSEGSALWELEYFSCMQASTAQRTTALGTFK